MEKRKNEFIEGIKKAEKFKQLAEDEKFKDAVKELLKMLNTESDIRNFEVADITMVHARKFAIQMLERWVREVLGIALSVEPEIDFPLDDIYKFK